MKLACLNVNGWSDQSRHDVLAAIEAKNTDVFSVLETKLRIEDKKKIKIPGFEVVESRREDAMGDKKGGGIAVLMRKTAGVGFSKFEPEIVKPELQYVSKERLWVTYHSQEGKTAVATVYLGFQASDDHHSVWNEGILEVLSEEVRDLRVKGFRILLQGDFNSWVGSDLTQGGIPGNRPRHPNKNGQMFLTFLAANSLTHVNGAVREIGNWATRLSKGLWTRHSIDHRSSTVIDYVVVSSEHLGTVQDLVVDQEGVYGGDSDHNMLFTTMTDKFISVRTNPTEHKPSWNIGQDTDMSKFKTVVQRELDALARADLGPGVDKLSDGLTSALVKGLDEGVGRRIIQPERQQLFPRTIVTLLKERKALESRFKSLKCKFALSNLQVPPESLLVARESLDAKSVELENALVKFRRRKRAPLLHLAKRRDRRGRKKFWEFVSRKVKKQGDISSLRDKDTDSLKFSPEDISAEIRKYLKTIFSGHDDVPGHEDEEVEDLDEDDSVDPGHETDDDDEIPAEEVHEDPAPNRDHEYEFKTHARLPEGGHGGDSGFDPAGFLDKPFTVGEVKSVIKELKVGKASGHDNVVNEALKAAPEVFFDMVTTMYNRVKDQSKVPRSWNRGKVVLIHKKGSRTDSSNYRPITVLTAMNGTYSKILNARLVEVVERHRLLGEVQNGFRKGRSGSDSAFVLNTVLWKSLAKHNKVHVSFLDLQKAYDSVDRNILWNKLRKLGFGGKFLDSIISMYKGDFVTCQTNGVTTEPVYLGRGLRQGCSLSPLLFALYVVDMSRELVSSNLGVLLRKICVSALLFADDIVLIGKSSEALKLLLRIIQKHCTNLRMKISITKSKVMSCSNDIWELFEEQEVVGCLEKVLQFRYLGVETCLHPSQSSRAMRKRAVFIANKYKSACLRLARDGPDIVDLAASLWLNIAIPSILFGCETVPFTSQVLEEVSRYQSSIGKFSLGLPSCAPNISGSVILGLKPFKQLLYSSQLKYYLRLTKMNDDRWAKDALYDNILGGWNSPYVRLLGDIRTEVGMTRWPVSVNHVDTVLNHHFLSETNAEIDRLSLPALEPLTKRARMEHVDESFESQVTLFYIFNSLLVFIIVPQLPEDVKYFCSLFFSLLSGYAGLVDDEFCFLILQQTLQYCINFTLTYSIFSCRAITCLCSYYIFSSQAVTDLDV